MSPSDAPYMPVRRVGDWLAVSGQIGLAEDGDGARKLVGGGTVPELRQAIANLRTVLAKEWTTLEKVFKTTVFLTDMGEFDEVNRVWIEEFAEPRPARSCVEVSALPLGARVEVEAWAHSPRV
jgi:2-iminobutanoate/2-iminopropanoate deaminase